MLSPLRLRAVKNAINLEKKTSRNNFMKPTRVFQEFSVYLLKGIEKRLIESCGTEQLDFIVSAINFLLITCKLIANWCLWNFAEQSQVKLLREKLLSEFSLNSMWVRVCSFNWKAIIFKYKVFLLIFFIIELIFNCTETESKQKLSSALKANSDHMKFYKCTHAVDKFCLH